MPYGLGRSSFNRCKMLNSALRHKPQRLGQMDKEEDKINAGYETKCFKYFLRTPFLKCFGKHLLPFITVFQTNNVY